MAGIGNGFMLRIFILLLILVHVAHGADRRRPNILLVTVDDMSADSVGAFGCKLAGTTPHIDRLARQSLKFNHAHVQVGNCYPSRNVMQSGRYPHNSGVEGFYRVQNEYPVLCDLMKEAGYYAAIRGKVTHTTPYSPYDWDEDLTIKPDGGKEDMKEAASYHRSTKRGIANAKKAGKPFYINVNISDPHKPFWKPGDKNPTSREFTEKEVPVPGFLFDHPDIRKELVLYYNSVRRADDCVGEILRALKESGAGDDTVVIFLSDHGMPLPFAKTALWHHSTRTPLLVKAPGLTRAGTADDTHMVSAVDLTPTILDLIGAKHPAGFDGRSFEPLLRGEKQSGREFVFKVYNENAGGGRHPMRGIQTRDHLYLWNPWSDGTNKFKTATTGTASYRTMVKVAQGDPAVAKRLELFDHRVPEELYHVSSDPDCLVNQIDNPEHARELAKVRFLLEAIMGQTDDHALAPFLKRDDPSAGPAYTAARQAESDARRANKRKGNNAKKNRKGRKPAAKQNP